MEQVVDSLKIDFFEGYMEKYNLEDCTVIIPVAIDFPERLEHVNFLLQYFPRFFINFQLIVVELGKEPIINCPNLPGIHHEFLRSEKKFSLTEICNIGASLVKTPFFCKCDTDVLIHPKAIFEALEILKSDPQISFILPYNGISINIKNPSREELMKSFDFDRLPFIQSAKAHFELPDMYSKCLDSKGLIHLFRTSSFKLAGGYNEEFIIWGFEDNEIHIRFEKLGLQINRLENYNVYHLYHPKEELDANLRVTNMKKQHFVERMTRDELKTYIKTWSRF